jgi:acid phosphatase
MLIGIWKAEPLAIFFLLIPTSFANLQEPYSDPSAGFLESYMAFGSAGAPASNATLTLKPPQVPLEVDKYPIAPEALKLEQVHVFVRHGMIDLPRLSKDFISQTIGERTPVSVRMAEPPGNIPEHWMMCRMAKTFRTAVSGSTTKGQVTDNGPVRIARAVERVDGTSTDGEW